MWECSDLFQKEGKRQWKERGSGSNHQLLVLSSALAVIPGVDKLGFDSERRVSNFVNHPQ